MNTVKGRDDEEMERREAGGQAQGTEPGNNRNSGENGRDTAKAVIKDMGGENFSGTQKELGWKPRVCAESQAKLMKRGPHLDTLWWDSERESSIS